MGFDAAVNSAIGRRLRCRREELALTREKLAECAEISVQFLADIETGRKGMTVQTLRKLALALHCSAADWYSARNRRWPPNSPRWRPAWTA